MGSLAVRRGRNFLSHAGRTSGRAGRPFPSRFLEIRFAEPGRENQDGTGDSRVSVPRPVLGVMVSLVRIRVTTFRRKRRGGQSVKGAG